MQEIVYILNSGGDRHCADSVGRTINLVMNGLPPAHFLLTRSIVED